MELSGELSGSGMYVAYLPYSDARDAYPLDNFDEASAPYIALKKEYDEYEVFLKKQANSGVQSEQAFGIRLWRQFGRGTASTGAESGMVRTGYFNSATSLRNIQHKCTVRLSDPGKK